MNRFVKQGPDKLGPLIEKLLARRHRAVTKSPQARAGGIKAAVIQVLELSEKPLSLREVHARCEELVDREVSYNTVKDCVHKHIEVRLQPFRE